MIIKINGTPISNDSSNGEKIDTFENVNEKELQKNDTKGIEANNSELLVSQICTQTQLDLIDTIEENQSSLSKELLETVNAIEKPKESFSKILEPIYSLDKALRESEVMKQCTEALNSINQNPVFKEVGELVHKTNEEFLKFTNKNLKLYESCLNVSEKILKQYNSFFSDISIKLTETITRSPFLDWIQSIDPIDKVEESRKKQLKVIMQSLYQYKWFPYVANEAVVDILLELLTVKNGKETCGKEEKQLIDSKICQYYSEQNLLCMQNNWDNSDLSEVLKRMYKESMQAHLRGEYALCISCLATSWESVLSLKYGCFESRKKIDTKTIKKELKDLTFFNNFDEIIFDYINNMIYATCNSIEDIIEDTPNRHAVSHSWFKEYPSEKASLNAILFTDFLINLKPMPEQDRQED